MNLGRDKFGTPMKLGRLRPGPVLSAKGIYGCPGITCRHQCFYLLKRRLVVGIGFDGSDIHQC